MLPFQLNGKEPPLNDKVLIGLESYAHFLATGAPTGANLPGRGYPKLPQPARLNYAHGQQVYAQKCALCHRPDGQGQSVADGTVVFPPLWGPRSYNWGAGMASIDSAAGFAKANMPFSQEIPSPTKKRGMPRPISTARSARKILASAAQSPRPARRITTHRSICTGRQSTVSFWVRTRAAASIAVTRSPQTVVVAEEV